MKTRKYLVLLCASVLCVPLLPVHAEPDYSDTDYWTEKCSSTSSLSDSDQQACRAFIQYAASQSESLSKKLTEITARRDEITSDIDDYQTVIDEYQKQSDDLSAQAGDLEDQISELEKKIEDGEKKEEDLREKVRLQVSTQQSGMRLNRYIDILMGARSFTDFLRILSGITDIVNHSNDLIEEYKDTVSSLKEDRAELETSQTDLQAKQEDIIASQYSARLVQDQYLIDRGELDEEIHDVTLAQGAAQASAADVQSALDAALAAMRAQQAAAEEAARQQAAAEEAARQQAEAEEAARQQAAEEQKKQQESGGDTPAPAPTPVPTPTPAPEPTPAPVPDNKADLRANIVETAMAYIGYPYVWAAAGPDAFDCSGFTQYIYGQYGIWLSHSSAVQENTGYGVSEADLLPGDLVTWHGHVGIYVGRDGSGAPLCINALNPDYGVCVLRVQDIIVPGGGLQYRRVL